MPKHADPTIPPTINKAPNVLASSAVKSYLAVASPTTVPRVLKAP